MTTNSGVFQVDHRYSISHDCRTDDIAGDANHEQLAEAGVEDELRGNARIAAADDGGVGTLPLRELRQDFLLHGREAAAPRRIVRYPPSSRRAHHPHESAGNVGERSAHGR